MAHGVVRFFLQAFCDIMSWMVLSCNLDRLCFGVSNSIWILLSFPVFSVDLGHPLHFQRWTLWQSVAVFTMWLQVMWFWAPRKAVRRQNVVTRSAGRRFSLPVGTFVENCQDCTMLVLSALHCLIGRHDQSSAVWCMSPATRHIE